MEIRIPPPRPFSTFEIGLATTIKEVEVAHLVKVASMPNPVVFGYLCNDWVRLKRQIADGDELRYFQSEQGNGLALIRENKVINWIGCGIPPDKRRATVGDKASIVAASNSDAKPQQTCRYTDCTMPCCLHSVYCEVHHTQQLQRVGIRTRNQQ